MSYCLNPQCPTPQNPDATKFCLSCGSKLLLRDRYRAIQPIGEGGFGRTFLGVDEDRLKTRCAIKQFFPQFQGTVALEKATKMFNEEAVRLCELGEHPQIPALLAYFEADKRLYLVQDFIEGLNLLQELMQEGAFSEQKILDLLRDLLPVLHFIHSHRVIHRDIKPENILRRIRDRKLVLVDFGVAKQGSGTLLAQTGTRTGTQGYAPMEQIRGGQAYPASDLYSLGVTCIQLLTKAMPDQLYDPMQAEWIWRSQLAKQGKMVSDRLGKILDKMLQERVSDRYQSAAEILQDLNAASTSTAPFPVISAVPPANVQSPASNRPISAKSIDPIQAELEAIKSQMSQAPIVKPKSGQKSPSQPQQPQNFDPIQAELESIKTEFGKET